MNAHYSGFALVLALAVTAPAHAKAPDAPARRAIAITAQKYHFTPSTIMLKKGEPVTLVLSSKDREHGFFIRPFGIDADIEPGKPIEIELTPRTAGEFSAICDDYCGIGHNFMRMKIVVR